MNLMMNSIEAMKDVDGPRELIIRSRTEDGQVMVSVSRHRRGAPAAAGRLNLQRIFTTKAHGTGMDFASSRSIVEVPWRPLVG